MYEFTSQLADLAVLPPPQMQQLLGAIAGNQKAMDEFASMFAGALVAVTVRHDRWSQQPHAKPPPGRGVSL